MNWKKTFFLGASIITGLGVGGYFAALAAGPLVTIGVARWLEQTVPAVSGAGQTQAVMDSTTHTLQISSNGAPYGIVNFDANSNTRIGVTAGNAITSGTGNVLTGSAAGAAITSGSSNTVVGTGAGSVITTGISNTVIGHTATTAANNTTNGVSVGDLASGATNGTAVGAGSSAAATSAAIGSGSTAGANQFVAGSGTANLSTIFFGKGASAAAPTTYNITGTAATAASGANGGTVGVISGAQDGAGTHGQVQLGTAPTTAVATAEVIASPASAARVGLAIEGIASQSANLFEIRGSGGVLENAISIGGATYSGSNNTNLGVNAGHTLTGGIQNVNIGTNAGTALLGGSNNTNIGNSAGNALTSGGANTFVGSASGLLESTGSFNTFIGQISGSFATSDSNTSVGYSSMGSLSTGTSNTTVGSIAGGVVTTGTDNVFIGAGATALASGTTGGIAIGSGAITDNNQFVVGSSGHPVFNWYGPNGVTTTGITNRNLTINATGGSGANANGGTLSLNAGIGTGNATGGNVTFVLPVTVGSGSSPNTQFTAGSFATDGTNNADTAFSVSANSGATIIRKTKTESLTLTGATTDTTGNLLPANSYILAVAFRVTTTLPNSRTFSIGIAGNTTLYIAAGTSGTSTTTGSSWSNAAPVAPANNGAAAKIRVTASNADAANGVIEIVTFYETITPPGT